jgi:hypothetical protein
MRLPRASHLVFAAENMRMHRHNCRRAVAR